MKPLQASLFGWMSVLMLSACGADNEELMGNVEELGIEESPLWGDGNNGCTPAQLPVSLGIAQYGTRTYRLKLSKPQSDGSHHCLESSSIVHSGGLRDVYTTETCKSAPRWQVFAQGANKIAICDPNSVRYCDALGASDEVAYVASCVVTSTNYKPGTVFLAETSTLAQLNKQTNTWTTYLPWIVSPSGVTDQFYIQSRYVGLDYLTLKPTAGEHDPLIVYDDKFSTTTGAARQIWDLL